MCGIGALISTGPPVLPAWAQRMGDMVRHRGPDGEGRVAFVHGDLHAHPLAGPETPPTCIVAGHPYLPSSRSADEAMPADVVLVHRRLAIVDLSAAGHQPMSFADGRYWIVFNGEIYNHAELRVELEAQGHAFVSHADTEVILAAYHQWGAACLDRFNGMFSFVIVDRLRRAMFAARDRFGVKPLYYWVSEAGHVAFASEIKQFTVLPGWRPVLDGQRAYDYLAWSLSEHTDRTLFRGVFQLRGGDCLAMDLDALRTVRPGAALPVRQWYALAQVGAGAGHGDAVARFGELLEDAVRIRLRADVSVGSCLSGGLDSSSIVCLAHRLLQQAGSTERQHTFTAYSTVAALDERPYAAAVIDKTGVLPTFVAPDGDMLMERLASMAWTQDEPYGSTSMFAQWSVFESAAAAGIKVVLDGQGADESLAGYPVFWGARFAALLRGGDLPGLLREMGALRQLRNTGFGNSVSLMAGSLLPEGVLEAGRFLRGDIADPAWLDTGRLEARRESPFRSSGGTGRGTIRRLSLAQITRTNLPMLLHWEDRNSMAHGVEARVPFLDYRLVEFALSLDDGLKLSGGWGKRILRDAMKGILPESVRLRRDKLGFETPELQWMRARPQRYRDAIARSAEAGTGIIRADDAIRLFDSMIAGTAPYSFVPWRIVSFGAWLDAFGVQCP